MVSVKKYFKVDVKSAEDGTFSGILSTYGNIDRVGDICEFGCFDESVRRKGTHYPLLWNHDDDKPIGSFDVIDVQDKSGLHISGRFNLGVQRAREAHSLVKAGDVTGLSIGYVPTKFNFDQEGIRHLVEVELFEGSIVSFPANELAGITEAKKMNDDLMDFRKGMIRALKSSGKSDEEINKLVEEAEKGCGECTDRKEEEQPKDEEKPEVKPEEESKGKKEGDEPPKDKEGEGDKPNLEELAKALKECSDNLAKLLNKEE